MDVVLKNLAKISKDIMESPEKNITRISNVLSLKDHSTKVKNIVFLSVLKIFKNIIPLYKVRTLKDKIIHKKDNLEINNYDKQLLNAYSLFINKICNDNSFVSYKCCCEILEHIDHFNYIDKVVNKILKGTLVSKGEENQSSNITIADMCLDTIRKKVTEDHKGDTIFVIVNQLYENNFNSKILSYLTEISFLDELVEEEISKKKDKFFKVHRSRKKEERRDEKKRRKLEVQAREEERKEEKIDKFVLHRKIVDALQRLYFMILRDKKKDKFNSTFKGIVKYKHFVRKEFLEGLYILLNDAVVLSSYEAKLNGIICILEIYEKYGYDFKRLVNALYAVLYSFNYNLSENNLKLVENIINVLFMKLRQPIQRVHVILNRLIMLGCIRHSETVKRLIKDLGIYYDIDFNDLFTFVETEFENETDVDKIVLNPFFNYFLLKKML